VQAKKLMEFQKHQVLMKAKRKAAAKMEELQEAAQIQLSLKDQVTQFLLPSITT